MSNDDEIEIILTNVNFLGGKHGVSIERGGVKMNADNVNFYEQSEIGLNISSPKPVLKTLQIDTIEQAKEVYELLQLVSRKKPEEHEEIIKESKFFRNLDIVADVQAVISTVIGLATTTNFHQLMKQVFEHLSQKS